MADFLNLNTYLHRFIGCIVRGNGVEIHLGNFFRWAPLALSRQIGEEVFVDLLYCSSINYLSSKRPLLPTYDFAISMTIPQRGLRPGEVGRRSVEDQCQLRHTNKQEIQLST